LAAARAAVFFRAVFFTAFFTAERRAGVVLFFAAVLRAFAEVLRVFAAVARAVLAAAVCFRIVFFAKLTSDRINARQMPVSGCVLRRPQRFA